MTPFPSLYPARSRQQNIDLIKSIRSASSQDEFEQADQQFCASLHPSLFAELDWMEMTMPSQQRQDGARLVDDIFVYHLKEIIAQRAIEFDLPDSELDFEVSANLGFFLNLLDDEQDPLQVLDKKTQQRIKESINKEHQTPEQIIDRICSQEKSRIFQTFSNITDPNWLLLKIEVEIKNAFAQSLDHVTSRISTKHFLRKIGDQFPQMQVTSIDSDEDLNSLRDDLTSLGNAAKKNAVFVLASICHLLVDVVSALSFDQLDRYGGELAAGYGGCGNCSMMYASSAIISFDPTCPDLFEGDDNHIYLPARFNVSVCPFCGEEARAESPAMFYSAERHQVIYNFPRLGQYTEEEAREVHRPLISSLRQIYLEKVNADEAEKFNTASEELTYSAAEFLLAIQMGTTAKEEHVYLVARLADGSGLIVDNTKGALIGLTRTEMQSAWAAARTVDMAAALEDEGLGGGPEVKRAMEAYAEGQYERSRDILLELHKRHPEDNVVKKNLAAAYISLGDKESAKQLYHR